MPHNELLFKLWRLGVTGKLWHWFKNYLDGRKYFVHLEGINYSLLPVYSGVPQGSIFGPLLFIVYINVMNPIRNSSVLIFAEDTKLRTSLTEQDQILLQDDIDHISDCMVHKMETQAKQFQMCSHAVRKTSTLNFSNLPSKWSTISYKESHKDLGVTYLTLFQGQTIVITFARKHTRHST